MDQGPPTGSASSPALRLDTSVHGTHTLVSVVGEIDVSSVGGLRAALSRLLVDGDVHLLLDLAGVTFMDSAGLGVLVGIQKQARMFRGSLAIVAPSRPVRRILELTSLDKVFRCCDTLAEALGGSLDQAPGGSRGGSLGESSGATGHDRREPVLD